MWCRSRTENPLQYFIFNFFFFYFLNEQYSVLSSVYGVQCRVHTVYPVVYSAQFIVYNVHCKVSMVAPSSTLRWNLVRADPVQAAA